MSLILIGMPSCGKSTLGVLLAKQLGYRFMDTDLLIQESEGKLLHEIISEKGIDEFIRIEERVNSSVTETNAVIATGGSVIYGDKAMQNLKKLGKVVYLELSYEEMCSRLGDYSHRGVVMPGGGTLADMYAQRKPLYEKYADITVNVCKASLTENIVKICTALEEKG